MSVPRGPWLALALALMLAAPSAAQVTVDLLETPDVIVANEPEDTFNNPDYVFTVTARVSNGEQAYNVSMHAITYIDQDVEGCPTEGTDHPPPRVFLLQKRLDMPPQSSFTVGGSTDPQTANQDPKSYWPLAVSKTYRDRGGNNVSYAEGEHSFCIVAVDIDCAAEQRPLRECALDRQAFRSYVRRTNEPPAITELEVRPEHPRPGQTVLLSAEAIDNSTKPRQDSLSFTWTVRGETSHGSSTQASFPTHGFHEVDLEVTDGFDTVNRTVEVPVGNVSTSDDGDTDGVPAPGWVALLVTLSLAARLRRSS